ncbi:hypothetical protein [Sphingomonas kyeonggiensis]|jgi:hypothetical protein|uniref:Uncharacterized protein n=1 Tax=Sphingomonas kyeonggiensis TaxID=1268553 RepID=A0A7W6JPR8_9SPHN|nr:hypothetical protein [Sphingomonas kyeonggiensis]MBB4097301.1 hypothetical protein [Sphingomonas kyeonggiensis]
MSGLLLIVEDTFDIPSLGGLIVVPGPLQQDYHGPLELSVVLKKPDGSEQFDTLRMQHVFQTPPPKELRWVCRLTGASKNDVPIGTQVWAV